MKNKFYFKENESLDSLVNYLVSLKSLEAILLDGELGAGKTTLTSAIARKLGEKKIVVSPTFNTMICYDNLVHIDAYKLRGNLFAYEEYFENKLVVIEWSKNISHNFKNYVSINVTLELVDDEVYHVFEITNNTITKSLFVETSLEDLFLAVIENNQVIDYILEEKLVKKTDLFFEKVNDLLARNNLSIEYFDCIYTTKGPGSFTGSRLGFSFAATNFLLHKPLLNNDLKIMLSPTYELFFSQLNRNIIYIKANKYKTYMVTKENNEISINLSDEIEKIDKFDYQLFIKNPSQYLSLFSQCNNVLDEELIYASDPQIGGL
ncbi:tRNA (adenosine(37)-N6)-threonylcarbamoyltransferase complex ATPase subunit type 1 TsaE [Metamycoplasma auris]|uniref:tRNA threonylcarbamoyladenosine biosynthesis protein TsaE n=1 Tax=Metamycoplasma auris TaxID=51363 RepID=A0A2W7GR47_9BACT|nr:tRNA (adenosine(37)-N6)-threonylcarbamoyltransferase complex ATPase subunit type 1 TsaE [Metamycoplasma auris]PZV99808.1 tRNA threonylcarbamoyladenosine biosynthesis protein TsaE [Metamycoplasma auris]